MKTITVSPQPPATAVVLSGTSDYTKRKLAIAFFVCFISIMFSGISSMLMSVYLPDVVKNLLGKVTDEKMNNVGAYINSIFIFGSMFGGRSEERRVGKECR